MIDFKYNSWTRVRGTIEGSPVEVGAGHWVSEGWTFEITRLDDRVPSPRAAMVMTVLKQIPEGRELEDIQSALDWAGFVPEVTV